MQARGQELGDGAESLEQVWERAQGCWQHVIQVLLFLRLLVHPCCGLSVHHVAHHIIRVQRVLSSHT